MIDEAESGFQTRITVAEHIFEGETTRYFFR